MARERRQSRGKKINPTLFVFCEGETEEAYVQMLKRLYRLPSVQIDPKIGGSNISREYIENYKKTKSTHPKDIDYLMYDADVPGLISKLRRITNCILIVSNPSLELWFLLHYKNQKANINSAECCRQLKNRNGIYSKGKIDAKLSNKLIDRMNEAIIRAKGLTEFQNPSSNIHIFIEKLDELKS